MNNLLNVNRKISAFTITILECHVEGFYLEVYWEQTSDRKIKIDRLRQIGWSTSLQSVIKVTCST